MATRTKSIAQELNRFYGRVPGEKNTKNFKCNPGMKKCTSCWRIDTEIRENERGGFRGIFGFGEPIIAVSAVAETTAEILINKETEEFCFNPVYSRADADRFFRKNLGNPKIGGIKPLKSEKYGISWEYDRKFRPKKSRR